MFEASGLRLIGPLFIMSGAFVFDSNAGAAAAFLLMIDEFPDLLPGDMTLQPASAPHLGDETKAYAGEAVLPPTQVDPETTYLVGLLFWREGRVIYATLVAGLSGDQLPVVFAIGRAITGRELNDEPAAVPASSQEMRTGGVWDLLPTLADIPEGFVFKGDEEIMALNAAGTPVP